MFILYAYSLMASFFFGGFTEASDEYQVKLALIERFVIHIEWPKNARHNSPDKPFLFGIYGDVSPFGDALVDLKNNRQIKWKKVEVRFYETAEDLGMTPPDLLFVSKDYANSMEAIGTQLVGKPSFVIAEGKNALEQGAMLSFFDDGEKILFGLGASVERERFKISDELRRLASEP